MPERSVGSANYRYLYNGMEVDNEVSGNGNSYTTEFRQYDPRLGRWKSLDPLMMMFPWMSPYVAFDNNPIYFTDIYGLEGDGPEDDDLPTNPDEHGPGLMGDHGGGGFSDDPLSVASGDNTPGVGSDFGSRKIPMYSPGGELIINPQPIYDDIGANTEIKSRVYSSNSVLIKAMEGLMLDFAFTPQAKKLYWVSLNIL